MEPQPQTWYYKLWIEESTSPGMFYVDEDTRGVNSRCFYKAEKIEDWPAGVTFYVEAHRQEDILFAGRWTLVSDRFRLACQEFGTPGFQFLPVAMINTITTKTIDRYWALNITQTLEALNIEHTRWIKPGQIADTNILQAALTWEKVKDVDAFCLSLDGTPSTAHTYISDRLKTHLEQSDTTTGIHLIPIPVY